MIWLALLTCRPGPTDDSASTDTDTAPVITGALAVSLRDALVTEATISGTFAAATALSLTCDGAGDHQVPETHLWTSTSEATTHIAVLSGLLADTEYTCTANGLDAVDPVSFTTGPLPADLTVHQITLQTWENGAETGWTLINPFTFITLDNHLDAYLVVLDMEGRVRWYYATEHDGIVAFDFNEEAQAFWTGGGLTTVYEPTAINLDATVRHTTTSKADHDVEWIGDDAWALVQAASGTCIERRNWADDTLVGESCSANLGLGGLRWNSLDVVPVEDGHIFFAGSASSDRIVKAHFERNELLWVFGPGQDFVGSITFDYSHDVNQVPCDSHDVCISFYDNGEPAERSEAEIFGLDETIGIAVPLRIWSESGWFEPRMGGLQVLDGGNLLIGVGHLELLEPDGSPSMVMEVDPDDNVVWRIQITPEDSAIYRARRVGPCKLFGHTGYCPG